jgi:hypothetical protein
LLAPDQVATFDQEGNYFNVSIARIKAVRDVSEIRTIKLNLTVKNNGKEPFTLMAYPKLTDTGQNSYAGKSIFFGVVNPGYGSTENVEIIVPSKEASRLLEQEAVLTIRFQTLRPMPYEASWKIDLKKY